MGVCNPHWWHKFPESVVVHLPQLKSYHKPLLIVVSGLVNQRQYVRPFRFLASWLTHEDFPKVVEHAWKERDDWISSSSDFREEATTWNNEIFGNIFRRKHRLMKRLEGINLRISMVFNRGLEDLQRKLWKEYHTVLV